MTQYEVLEYFYKRFIECDFEHYSVRQTAQALSLYPKCANQQINSLFKMGYLVVKQRQKYTNGFANYDYGRIFRLNPKAFKKCKAMFDKEHKSLKSFNHSETKIINTPTKETIANTNYTNEV
jgi:hypothetical protein